MNVMAQMRPWPAQEKMVYTTCTTPGLAHLPFQRRRGLVRGPQHQPERGRAVPRRVSLHRRQPGAEHQRRDKLAKHGFLGSRTPAYLVPSPGAALDSPLLQAQVVAACACAPPDDRRLVAGLTGRCVPECHGNVACIRTRSRRCMMSSMRRSCCTSTSTMCRTTHTRIWTRRWTGPLVSPLKLTPVRGNVAWRWSLKGDVPLSHRCRFIPAGRWRTFPEGIFLYEYPFTASPLRASLRSILCRL
ncbi:hypothetical protein B0H13DRAFT_1188814 [Mycena leptocephala]|nr:hypothetical protein B0H13DRAFT_1188814 [Mycena leptocephala]